MSLNLPGDLDMLSMIKESPRFVEVYIPLQIDSVMKDSPASKLGLAKGDKILAINGKKVESFNDFQLELGRMSDVLASASTHQDSVKALTASVEYLKASGDTLKNNVLLLAWQIQTHRLAITDDIHTRGGRNIAIHIAIEGLKLALLCTHQDIMILESKRLGLGIELHTLGHVLDEPEFAGRPRHAEHD